MAVPKKRISKSKSGKQSWKAKAYFVGERSFSLAKSLLSGKSTSFAYYKSTQNDN
uniref:Ribosomal protein L32 n=1 Tax=Bostrychia simpliciuscula TaxID=324754 RepID=A0A1Z1M7Y0_9FLOR|nr:ribosomal protein L32 [Bostrychia simpliciuscula]ARW62002.1 ribosomal protein L32 [Bostrychia simpliciuscula]